MGPTNRTPGTIAGRLWADESGQDTAEYALLTALIAIALIGALTALGGDLDGFYRDVTGEMP